MCSQWDAWDKLIMEQNEKLKAGEDPSQLKSKEQANTIYRAWRLTQTKVGGTLKHRESEYDSDLKNFFIRVCLHKETLKTVSFLCLIGSRKSLTIINFYWSSKSMQYAHVSSV